MEIYEAKAGNENQMDLNEALGKVSAAMICIYPPGAPIVVPGEEITEQVIEIIHEAKIKGLHVTGLSNDSISVVN